MAETEETVHSCAGGPNLIAARERLKTGRNDACPCGSGRKYKKCCLRADEDRARREAAASEFQSPALAKPGLGAGEAAPSRELSAAERRIDELWRWVDSLSSPSAAQLDEWLEQLLALPAEGTDWNDVLHTCASKGHPDLPAVFRRIAARVPHTHDTAMSYFYWGAGEEFARRGFTALLPEVAAAFANLDQHSYDADALAHLEDFLLAARCETQALALAEHFLPIVRADSGLMHSAVIEQCNLIFQLRAGIALRGGCGLPASPHLVTAALRRDLEDDIENEAIGHAVLVVCDTADPAWTRAHFDLGTSDIRESEQAWQDCLRLYDSLLRVARDAWRVDGVPPGWAFAGLSQLLASVYRAGNRDGMKRSGNSKTLQGSRRRNLLDYLNPAGMEQRIARACPDVLGVSAARAQILVDAHAVLLDLASRQQLLADGNVAAARTELVRLRGVLAPTCSAQERSVRESDESSQRPSA